MKSFFVSIGNFFKRGWEKLKSFFKKLGNGIVLYFRKSFDYIKNKWKKDDKTVITMPQLILTVVYVVALIVSNLISAQLIVMPWANVSGFIGNTFGKMTSAIIVFPIVCILSDIFSEIFLYRYSRITCYIAFVLNLFVDLILSLVASIDITGDGAEAFKQLFGGSGMGWCVLFASFLALLAGDLVDDLVFSKMKDKHPNDHKSFGFRAVLSTVFGQLIDSCIYLPLALIVFPTWFHGSPYITGWACLGMIAMQIVIKVLYEIITLPLTKLIVKKVKIAHDNSK